MVEQRIFSFEYRGKSERKSSAYDIQGIRGIYQEHQRAELELIPKALCIHENVEVAMSTMSKLNSRLSSSSVS